MRMVYPSLTAGLMAPHQILATTENIENVTNKAKNKIQLTKIRWEDAPNVDNYTSNESEGARQVQINTVK